MPGYTLAGGIFWPVTPALFCVQKSPVYSSESLLFQFQARHVIVELSCSWSDAGTALLHIKLWPGARDMARKYLEKYKDRNIWGRGLD